MKALIIGASAGVGRAIAEHLASRRHELAIVASDLRDLEALSRDLNLRCGAIVHPIAADITTTHPDALCARILETIGSPDAIFLIAGVANPRDCGDLSDTDLSGLVAVNFLAHARLINALLPALGPTHIVVAGSVAAIRARRRNGAYGAAKLALEQFVLSLAQGPAPRIASACCYRLGYVETGMTFGQKLPLPAVSAQTTARFMADGIGRREGIIYFPRWWRFIGAALNGIPYAIFKKLSIA